MRPLALASFLFPFLLHAQDTPKALLWRIQGPGLVRPSYLTGTIHSRDARAFTHASAVLAAIDSCDVVAGELDLGEGRSLKGLDASVLLLPNGTDLEDLLPKRKAKRVRAAITAKFGPLSALFLRAKPFYAAAALQEMAQRSDSSVVLDEYLQQVAAARGKTVMGLESMQEQLSAVDDVPLKEQAEMLYQAVREKSGAWDHLVDLYAAQDLDALAHLWKDDEAPADVMEQRLLHTRNGVMATRMDSLLRDGRTYLFAVGAGHLPSADGLIAQLRALGYRLEPMTGRLPETIGP